MRISATRLLGAALFLGACSPSAPVATPRPLPSAAPAPEARAFEIAEAPLPEHAILRFGTSAFSPGGSIESIAFSGDGERIATGTSEGAVQVWDRAGRLLFSASLGGAWIGPVALSSDGAQLAASNRQETRIFDVRPGALGVALPSGLYPAVLAFSPDGQLLGLSRLGSVALYDVQTGKLARESRFDDGTTAKVLVRSGGTLLSIRPVEEKGTFEVFDVLSGKGIRTLPSSLADEARPGAPDAALERIAICSEEREVILRSFSTGKIVSHLPAPEASPLEGAQGQPCTHIAFASNNAFVVTAEPGVGVFNRPLSGAPPQRLATGSLSALAISPDSSLIAFASYGGPLRLFRSDGGVERPRVGLDDAIHTLRLRASGSEIVTAPVGGEGVVWNTTSGARVGSAEARAEDNAESGDPVVRVNESLLRVSVRGRDTAPWLRDWNLRQDVREAVVTRDAASAVVWFRNDTLETLDLKHRKTRAVIATSGAPTTSILLSDNGKVLFRGRSDGGVSIHRVEDGSLLLDLRGHLGKVTHLTLDPPRKRLYSAATDRVVYAWDLAPIAEAYAPVETPTVDPALRRRLDTEPLSGIVRASWDIRLFPSAAAARADTSASTAVSRDSGFSFRVLADEGDVVRVRNEVPSSARLSTPHGNYALNVYVRRKDLVPVLRERKQQAFSDETAYLFREGMILDIVGGVRPAAAAFWDVPVTWSPQDAALSFQPAAKWLDLKPPKKVHACERTITLNEQRSGDPGRTLDMIPIKIVEKSCHLAPEDRHLSAPLRVGGAPGGEAHVWFPDSCDVLDLRESKTGTLLATREIGRAVVVAALDPRSLAEQPSCRGAGGGAVSGIGGLGARGTIRVWEVRGRVPAVFPDGTPAGHHLAPSTILYAPELRGDLVCKRLSGLTELVCHKQSLLRQVDVGK